MGLYAVQMASGRQLDVSLSPAGHSWQAQVGDRTLTIRLLGGCGEEGGLWLEVNGKKVCVPFADVSGALRSFVRDVSVHLPFAKKAQAPEQAASVMVESPIPGVVCALLAQPGECVKKGDPLVVVEAMKMENVLRAPVDGVVALHCGALGETVRKGQALFSLSPLSADTAAVSSEKKRLYPPLLPTSGALQARA